MPLENMNWRVRICRHDDDHVEKILPPYGTFRHLAKKIEDETNVTLDHDLFYAELVQLNEGKV